MVQPVGCEFDGYVDVCVCVEGGGGKVDEICLWEGNVRCDKRDNKRKYFVDGDVVVLGHGDVTGDVTDDEVM